MNSFKELFESYNWKDVEQSIGSKTEYDVRHALESDKVTLEDFKALLSPPAGAFLEQMTRKSREKTLKRFGNSIQLYTPMYLSNECNNVCTYCGFSYNNKIKRRTLTPDEIIQEAKVIKQMGFSNVLLVSGEANRTVNLPYFLNAVKAIRPYFSTISVEVQPL